MNKLTFTYEDVEEVISDKNKHLVIKFKKTEGATKLKFHLLKNFPGDQLDKN